jgi:cathepsin B
VWFFTMKLAAGSLFGSAAAGGTLALTWKDCGDATTHTKISGLSPTTLTLGQKTTVTGTGAVDEALSDGTFDMKVTAAGVKLLECSGDAGAAKTCQLPLGSGSITFEGEKFPVQAGSSSIAVDLDLSASLPSSLAKTTTTVTAQTSSGDKIFCLEVTTAPAETFESVVADVRAKNATWVAEVPPRFETVEDAKKHLGAFLPGHPSHKAPPVKEVEVNAAIPSDFDARTQWPACGGMASVRDQSSCGSCWAFGSTDSFQDRACVATGKDVRYSPEDTAFCSDAGMGCDGGNSAWDWFQGTGVVTGGDYFDIGKGDTCLPYSLAPCAHHVPASTKYPACPSSEYPSPQCTSQCSESKYSGKYSSDKVRASDAYSVRGVSQIQTELMNKGPMYVAFSVYSDFPTYKSGVYKHTSGSYLGGHAVELMGWGTENGQDYWLVKNSWNEQWGDGGFFKIARGVDECGIEDDVSAGTVSATVVV